MPLELLKGDSKALDAFAARLPDSIAAALDFPSLETIVALMGSNGPVLRFLENELIKVNDLLTQKMTGEAVVFIADQFLKKFPSYTLADFKICLQMGCIGDFDIDNPKPLYGFDGLTFRRWWEKYREKKFDAATRAIYRERDRVEGANPDPAVKPVSVEREKFWLDEWLKNVQNTVAIKPTRASRISPDEIKREGQVRPPAVEGKPPVSSWDDVISRELHITWITENHDHYGRPIPGYMNEKDWLLAVYNDKKKYSEIINSIKRL